MGIVKDEVGGVYKVDFFDRELLDCLVDFEMMLNVEGVKKRLTIGIRIWVICVMVLLL